MGDFAPTQKKMYYSVLTIETKKGCNLELTSLKFRGFLLVRLFAPMMEACKENYVH